MKQVSVEERLKTRILETSDKALNIVDAYLKGKEASNPKAGIAFRVLGQGVKILHMNQVRVLTERSQALRLLKFLPDEKSRREYIKLTNPQVAPLLLDRPKA